MAAKQRKTTDPNSPEGVNFGVISYKLDQLKEGQDNTLQKLEAYEIRLQSVELWKSKVEDSIKTVVASTRREEGDTAWEKYGLKIIMVALAIIWGLVTIVGGGKVQWPF